MQFVRETVGHNVPTGLPSMNPTVPADDQVNFRHPQYFISQSEKLTALLHIVVHESRSATSPDALIDYLELTEILTNLLDEARLYGVLSAEELQLREQEVLKYIDKIQIVQDAVGDWDVRTKMSMPASRKRARSVDLADDTMSAFKRQRDTESELDLVANASIPSPVPSVLPSIEELPAPWWTEPFCD